MPHHLCPLCKQPGRLLDAGRTSPFARSVEYYRCDPCWHVWAHNTADPNGPAVPVTMPSLIAQEAEEA